MQVLVWARVLVLVWAQVLAWVQVLVWVREEETASAAVWAQAGRALALEVPALALWDSWLHNRRRTSCTPTRVRKDTVACRRGGIHQGRWLLAEASALGLGLALGRLGSWLHTRRRTSDRLRRARKGKPSCTPDDSDIPRSKQMGRDMYETSKCSHCWSH